MKFLILDLDQTLIDDHEIPSSSIRVEHVGVLGSTAIYARPHLRTFLIYVFANFRGVSIWTKASKEWLDAALSTPPLCEFVEQFTFLWTGKRCSRIAMKTHCEFNSYPDVYSRPYTKPLKKVWKQKSLRRRGWNRMNTIIVDDKKENFLGNYGNGILVPEFDCEPACAIDDIALLQLIDFFESPGFQEAVDVRCIEKRNWMLI